MNRRSFLALGAAAAGLATSGCDFSFDQGVFNACRAALPDDLANHPLLRSAWQGLDPAKVWDVHCHVFGNGDSGSALWFNPRMESVWNFKEYLQKIFYLNAGCAHDDPGKVDLSVVDRLLDQCEAMPPGFHALLFAFDWARDDAGAPMPDRSTFHVPDEAAAALAERHPTRFEWAASIHPYDPRALDRLDAAAARRARAVKWLPSAQGIDPADPRCDRFYARLAAIGMPLITHAGDEKAVHGFGEHLGNPLRLRRPLEAGVRVVVAHCASLGDGEDLDRPGAPRLANFALFARLMDEPQYRVNLAGDISAVTQANRMQVIPTLLARRDWHDRLRNGSDYPLPGILPLVSLSALRERGLIAPGAVDPLREIRQHNVLLFDFVLKRTLSSNGTAFSPAVFETRPHFERPA
jgi:predicted TIM-barrel fold metal-dependent hydrolase